MQKNIKPIFLISLPRSGSTLLQRALSAHSSINTTAEPWLLLPFIYATKKDGTLTKYSHSISFQGIIDMVNLLPKKIDDFNGLLSNFVLRLYEALSAPGSKYFLDKTPRYYLVLDELYQIFPEAKFIFLFRNPVQIYASVLSTWGNKSFKALNKYRFYMDLNEGFEILSKKYNTFNGDSFSIQYEKFVNQSSNILNDALEFLELEPDNNLVESINKLEVNGRNFDPTMDLNRKLDNKSLGKWKNVFNSRYRKVVLKSYIDSIDEKCLAIQGYEKTTIINEILNLDSKGKFFWLKDAYEFNKAKLINRFDRVSYD